MKLTLALDMIAPTGKAAKAGTPAEAQDSAIPAEFSSLLASESPVLPEVGAELSPELAAMPGNDLPPGTGKSLPVAIAGEGEPTDTATTALVAPAVPVVANQPQAAASGTVPAEAQPVVHQPARIDPAQAAQAGKAEAQPEAAPDRQRGPAPQPAETAAAPRQPLNITVTAQQAAPVAQGAAPVLPAEVAERQQAAQANHLASQAILKPRGEVTVATSADDTGDAATGERQQGQPRAAAVAPAPAPASAPQALTITAEPQHVTTTAPADRTFAPASAAPERHDFNAVVERLAHARETAQPGRADMSLVHREFGNISVQFEMAGHALKVAMTSSDAAFAPAVQAALAERPIAAVADTARADTQAGRQDSQSSSSQNTASQQGQASPDGQRQDANSRSAQLRQQSGNQAVAQRAEGEGAPARASARHARDNGLFA